MDNSSNDIIVIEKDKLQRYLDLVGVVIVVVDRHGNVCVVNKRGCDVTGYNKDEIIGRNCFDNFFVDSSRQPSRAIFNQVISGEIEPIEFYETQILTKSGQERTILWHNDVIRDGGGAITYIISSGEDITDMLIRENALRESEEKFKALFEQAMDPLFLVDAKDGRILMFNESAHKLYGYSREEFELIKISDVEIVESPEEIMKHIKKIEKYGADSFETMHKTKDGRILHVHAGINNVRIGGKSHNIAIFRDITNMKHVESELIMRTKQLEEINKQLERRVQEQIDRMLAKERIIMQQAKIAADEAVLQAADILEKNGQVDRSIEQILKIKKWKRFEELINTHAQHIIDDGRHDTVDRWFSQVPYEIMRDYPWLMFWQGVNRQYINPPDARMILETAYALFKPIDKAGQLWALTAIVKTYLLQWTDFNPLDYWISEFEGQLIEVYQKSGNETLREAAISSIAPALMFRQPTHKDIDYWIAEAENIALNSKRFENRLITGYNLSIYYLWSGQVYKAGVIVERLSLPIRQSTGHPMLRLVCLGVEATYWVWRAEYAKAVKTADEGLEIARLTGIHLLDIVLLTASVFASLAIGDDTAAGGYQKRILSYMEGLQTYPATYHQTASLIEAANGALPFAVEHAEKWLSLAVHSGCPQMPAVHRFVLAYVLTEAGRHEEAMRHINEMEEIGAAVKSRLFENWGFAIKSLIALKTGGMTKFDAMFDNYVRLAKITGLKYILPLHKPVALICKTAIERNIQTDFVKDLITSHNIKADGHTIEHWPWAVKIYTLGRFEILRNGSPMQFSAKPQKTPL
ncbi:MAG: PAS domain-containing protein, partial [Candidatus Magnetominusculus sp. LBB02]|nr:PAS domain-containing protein [Candidatus Magnetominusculus sp. LBB02]